MKNLISLLIALGFVVTASAAIGQFSTYSMLLSPRTKRQANCDNIIEFLPIECTAGLDLANFGFHVFDIFGGRFCQPRCGNPLIDYFQQCGTPHLVEFVVQLCARNSQGVPCYSLSVASALNTTFTACSATLAGSNNATCSSGCQTALQATLPTVGCCINAVTAGSSNLFVNNLEDCGEDIPEPCSESTLSGPPTTAPNCPENEEELLETLPGECVAGLNVIGQNGGLDIYTSIGALFCRPQCGNLILQYYQDCLPDDIGQKASNFLIQLCAQNSQGARCYSSSVVSALNTTLNDCSGTIFVRNTTCSSSCQTAVQSTITTAGCCINLVDFGGFLNSTTNLRDNCDASIPGICSGSTLGSTPSTVSPTSESAGSVALTMSTLVGAFAVLMSATL